MNFMAALAGVVLGCLMCPHLAVAVGGTCSGSPDNVSFVQGDGECLAILTHDKGKGAGPLTLLVLLHGGKTKNEEFGWEPQWVEQFARPGVVSVLMMRPGFALGPNRKSSGYAHSEQNYTKHNMTAVGTAIGVLKQFHRAERLVLVGYSSGAAYSGVIAGLMPGLADTVVLIACPCIMSAHGSAGRRTYLSRAESPDDYINKIAPQTRVLAFAGTRDTTIEQDMPPKYDALLAKGKIQTELRIIDGANHGSIPRRREVINGVLEVLRGP